VLLLLDRNRRIYLANRAFKNLLKTNLRGKTVMGSPGRVA